MINLTNLELSVYEVVVASYDSDFGYSECIDSNYVVVDNRENTTLDDVISAGVGTTSLTDCMLLVYEARSADFTTMVYKSGKVEFDATGDIDCATGCNGNTIHEVYYDKKGEVFDPYDV